MPNHDPYGEPAFYDLAKQQSVDSPLDARSMVVKDPDDRVTELEQENQTLGERDFSLPPKMANIELVLRDHEARLVKLIENYEAAVGCVGWVTSLPILGALASRDAAALIVQKEDLLRPSPLGQPKQYHAYRQLKPFGLDELGGRFALMQEVSVRCTGVAKGSRSLQRSIDLRQCLVVELAAADLERVLNAVGADHYKYAPGVRSEAEHQQYRHETLIAGK
jgi:hypothetical protein